MVLVAGPETQGGAKELNIRNIGSLLLSHGRKGSVSLTHSGRPGVHGTTFCSYWTRSQVSEGLNLQALMTSGPRPVRMNMRFSHNL